MQALLSSIIEDNRHWTADGQVASYIPELAKADPNALGIAVITTDGTRYAAGDHDMPFTIQSISKILTFSCALLDTPFSELSRIISLEPTSDEFNSIASLEIKNTHKPLNPLINSGAIATLSLIRGASNEERFQRILDFAGLLTGNPALTLNHDVYQSESRTGHRNRALAYYMKSTDIIDGDVEALLDTYFRLCSLQVTCHDIAHIGAVLANSGLLPGSTQRVLPKHICRIVKAVMATCGMYNGSGIFATSVGLPAKSGVGGGILAVSPGRMGIGVMGPALDDKGNSLAGIKVLEHFSNQLDLSIY